MRGLFSFTLTAIHVRSLAAIFDDERILHPQFDGYPGEFTEFDSIVLVDFVGDLGSIFDSSKNPIDFKLIEKSFRDSYNELSKDLCDENFREILDVSVGRHNSERNQRVIPRGGKVFSLRYNIHARCRGCVPGEAFLFSVPQVELHTGKRDLKEQKQSKGIGSREFSSESIKQSGKSKEQKQSKPSGKSKEQKQSKSIGSREISSESIKQSGKSKGKKQSSQEISSKAIKRSGKRKSKKMKIGKGKSRKNSSESQFFCSSKSALFRAPTEEEFRETYESSLLALDAGASPKNIPTIGSVQKVTEIMMEPIPEFLAKLVRVQFFGNPRSVNDVERLWLETTFSQVYNGLQANRCDTPSFRSVALTKIELQGQHMDEGTFTYVFRVDATCHGFECGSTLRLFQQEFEVYDEIIETSRQRGSAGRSPVPLQHFLPNPEFECPRFPISFSAPTEDEFQSRYFDAIQELREHGVLFNIQASGEVDELPLASTPMPSLTPSSMPSTSAAPSSSALPTASIAPTSSTQPTVSPPSDSPSSLPSLEPSFGPSLTPSDQPSVSAAPSNFPSISPSDIPSEIPSQGPTRPPTREPSATPSQVPSLSPSENPSISIQPSSTPSDEPSQNPSISFNPTLSIQPSLIPSESALPSLTPSVSTQPSDVPSLSLNPSESPSFLPSVTPSEAPSDSPSKSISPSSPPSNSPSLSLAFVL